MDWITRERPKIDRIACPWLIKRWIDKEAVFHFVPYEEVKKSAKELNAIAFDIPGTEYTHYNDQCTFDYFVQKHQITDNAILSIADIVRGADTDRHDIAQQSSGLSAIFSGLSFNIKDDHELLEFGMIIYDALYSWARYLKNKKHTEGPTERLFTDLFEKFLRNKSKARESPYWVAELKALIQEGVEDDLKLSLKQLAQNLNVNPAYLSREFSKHFNNLTFTEYVRKVKIEKAVQLLKTTKYSLAEIAYTIGYADQSHFTRSFKKEIGIPPSSYRKKYR